MNARKTLIGAIVGCAMAVASTAALAVDCDTLDTIGDWVSAGSCDQGDKTFTIGTTDLSASAGVFFPGGGGFGFDINGFDNSTAAGSFFINYTVTVNDPTRFITDMFAEATIGYLPPGT